MLVQGVLMEGIVALALPVLLLLRIAQDDLTARAHVFALPYLQENLYLMMAMSGVFATLRVLGAIGVLRDRAWGFVLSVTMCVVTLALMVFLLPAGIADGVLSGLALVLLVFAKWGRAADGAPRTILDSTTSTPST